MDGGRSNDEDRLDCDIEMDFTEAGFVERARGDPPGIGLLTQFTVEIDFDWQSHPLSDGMRSFIAPRQLHAFLAHPMTGLDEETVQARNEVNRVIVSCFLGSIDPTFSFYDPADGFDPAGDCSNVYRDDEHMIFWADVLVVNHIRYADGIGMLANQAANHGIPIISVRPVGLELSPMYGGLPVRTWHQVEYSSLDDLKRKLDITIAQVISSVCSRAAQREKVNQIGGHPGKQFFKSRVAHQITLEELSIRTGWSPEALHRLENDANAFLRLPHTMVWTISIAIGAQAQIQSGCTSVRLPDLPAKLNQEFVRDSLANLVECVHGATRYCRRTDRAVIECWSKYSAMVTSLATREAPTPGGQRNYDKVVESDEWKRRIQYHMAELC